MKTIQLTRGKVAIVDDEDYDWLNYYKWNFSGRYAVRSEIVKGQRKTIFMHRMVFPNKTAPQVDHINRNSLDNRKENLRACVQSENSRNAGIGKANPSGYKGVFPYKGGQSPKKWRSQIVVDRKTIWLGLHHTKEAAARAYNQAALEYHGEFAYLNEIADDVQMIYPS